MFLSFVFYVVFIFCKIIYIICFLLNSIYIIRRSFFICMSNLCIFCFEIEGAVVKLQCNNTKYKLDETDKDGHFSLVGPKIITIYIAKQCNVVLVSAPHGLKLSNLHDGVTGAILRPKRRFVSKGVPFILLATQPLAFEPSCPR